MSNSKSAIQEIKKLMVQFGFLSTEPTMLDFKLEDDTILQAEKIEVGKSIFKINEQFEKVVLEDGKYSIPEKFEVEVEDGKIAVVNEIFANATLKDGTKVKATGKGLEVGSKMFVDKDGTDLPAPDGDHELSDGTLVTTKDGEIVSIETPSEEQGPGEKDETAAEEKHESPAEEGIEEASPAAKATADIPVHPYMNEMMDMLKEFINSASEKMAQMEEQYSSLSSEFNQFRKEPAGSKISQTKKELFTTTKLTENKVDELDARVAQIMRLKNNQ